MTGHCRRHVEAGPLQQKLISLPWFSIPQLMTREGIRWASLWRGRQKLLS